MTHEQRPRRGGGTVWKARLSVAARGLLLHRSWRLPLLEEGLLPPFEPTLRQNLIIQVLGLHGGGRRRAWQRVMDGGAPPSGAARYQGPQRHHREEETRHRVALSECQARRERRYA